jgi:hypothetical protein
MTRRPAGSTASALPLPSKRPVYSKHIRLRDLQYIARSARNGGEDTVETYYGWREARALTVARGFGAAAVSILTAWLIPVLKDEYSGASAWLIVATPVALVISLAVMGLVILLRMDRIHKSFIRAMVWLERLR